MNKPNVPRKSQAEVDRLREDLMSNPEQLGEEVLAWLAEGQPRPVLNARGRRVRAEREAREKRPS